MSATNASADLYKRLGPVIAQELQQAQDLLRILQEEQGLLGKNPEQMAPLLANKQEHIQKLETLDGERRRLLTEAGYEPTREGLESFLSALPAGNPLAKQWQTLLAVIGQCRRSNQLNGSIIEARRQSVLQALTILHGQTYNTGTYNPAGKTDEPRLSRSLAKA